MTRPTLDDLTPALDRSCADILGDTVSYAADGSTFANVQAYVDYRDAVKAFEAAQVVEQGITVSGMLKADVPDEPTGTARLTLARLPGLTFKPIGVRTDEAGTGWEFEVKQVASA